MKYMSLFSGIEAATVAWHPLGWEPVAFAEIEPFPCSVLAHHYPGVPNLGSVTDITDEQIKALGRIDVVVGGSPCQDLSVAGKRSGLAGERSGLFHEQIRIFNAARLFCGARWLVWENVPGAFSSNQGRDFAVVAGSMAGCDLDVPEDGWGTEGVALGDNGLVEWCVLDAQWFGVAQRRRRVFAVLDAGNWADRPPVLLERDGLRGDSPPSREQGKEIAPCLSARTKGGGRLGTDFDLDGGLITTQSSVAPPRYLMSEPGAKQQTYVLEHYSGETLSVHGTQDPDLLIDQAHTLGRNHGQENAILDVAPTLDANYGRLQGCSGQDLSNGHGLLVPEPRAFAIQAGATRINPLSGPDGVGVQEGIAYTLEARSEVQAVAFQERGRDGGRHLEIGGDIAFALTAPSGGGRSQERNLLDKAMRVRRLTPRECERLQGFPDDYTLIHVRGKPAADGPRYKALGNSMAVPVMRWIGKRIAAVDQHLEKSA